MIIVGYCTHFSTYKETHFPTNFPGSCWFMFVRFVKAQKKRDTFASVYRGVWHTLGIEWSKHTLMA